MTPDPSVQSGDPIRVVVVDDQLLLREGLKTLLELHTDLRVVGEAGDGFQGEAIVERTAPQVVLMDLRMPRRGGVAATKQIVARWPRVHVLVLTTYDDDELVFEAIEAGASGYLLKDVGSDALAEAIRAASRGESPLQPSIARKVLRRLRTAGEQQPRFGDSAPAEPFTARELDVLRALGSGATNHEIAESLSLTEGTVKNYVSVILAKTGLRDRTQAALYAVRHGYSGS
ncbi:MAG TPA: response regulator transcription factor [Dehalococcoidia bacterium]|nr:response regulator transcription factor [Dehalococcoidia bacterium]